jgi:hypothetical protein
MKFFDKKLQYSKGIYSQAFMKNFQVSEEASSSPKRTSSCSKHEISSLFGGSK